MKVNRWALNSMRNQTSAPLKVLIFLSSQMPRKTVEKQAYQRTILFSRKHVNKSRYSSLPKSSAIDFYQTKVVRIDYGSSSLSLDTWGSNRERVVFDSGSSYTYFTKEAYSQLVANLEELSAFGLIIQDSSDTICWKTESSIGSVKDVKPFFKPLTLQFGSRFWVVSTKLVIPPENYLLINKEGNVCLGILDGSQVHDGSTIILGDNALRGKLVVYDNVNQRIGWTSSDCRNPRKIKRLPLF